MGYIESIIEISVIIAVSILLMMLIDDKARHAFMIAAMSKNTVFGSFFIKKVKTDPMQQLKDYVAHLESKVLELRRHTNQLRGQRHVLKEAIVINENELTTHLTEASAQKNKDNTSLAALSLRKAGRLEESNKRLGQLYDRMTQLYQHLTRMYDASKVVLEDVKDQIHIQETEQKAIIAGHNAVQSAVSVLNGDNKENKMYGQSLEAVNTDVANRIGEMEEFLRLSQGMMQAIDLKQSMMEEDGLKLLADWEQKMQKADLLVSAMDKKAIPLPNTNPHQPDKSANAYDSFFDL